MPDPPMSTPNPCTLMRASISGGAWGRTRERVPEPVANRPAGGRLVQMEQDRAVPAVAQPPAGPGGRELSPEQYDVLWCSATEPPWTGKYVHHQVRVRDGVAELLRARSGGRGGVTARPQPWDDQD